MDDILKGRIKELAKKKDIIAKRIKNERKKLKLTQDELGEQLAKLFGEDPYRQSTISAWEKGSSLPPIEKLIALAQLFECDTCYLLGDINERRVGNMDAASYTGLEPEATEILHNLASDDLFKGTVTFLSNLIVMIDYKELGTKLAELVVAYTASCTASVNALIAKGDTFDDVHESIQKPVQILSDGTINLSALTAISYLMKSLADEVDEAARKSAKQITENIFQVMTKSTIDAHTKAKKSRPGATNTETANDQD